MPRISRLSLARKDIIQYFDRQQHREGQSVYTAHDLAQVLSVYRAEWRLAQRTTATQFVDYLRRTRFLREHTFKSESYRPITRYVWRKGTSFELAASLRPDAYLSHGTAVYLHGLTDLVPTTIYVNKEQTPKARGGELKQASLDRAFAAKEHRRSKYEYRLGDYRYLLLSGMATDNLGVTQVRDPDDALVPCTTVERTLIDILVRPGYAGGIYEVRSVYERAEPTASARIIAHHLRELEYVYPYHQAIGFLMERAGYSTRRTAALRRMGLNFDFYLTYGLSKTDAEYSADWRLYYPRGF